MHSYLSSIISISLVLLLVGFFALLAVNARSVSNYFKENIRISLVLSGNTEEARALQIDSAVQAMPQVKITRYISKEQGTREMKELLGEDFLDVFQTNPIPISIEVQLKADYFSEDSIGVFKRAARRYRRHRRSAVRKLRNRDNQQQYREDRFYSTRLYPFIALYIVRAYKQYGQAECLLETLFDIYHASCGGDQGFHPGAVFDKGRFPGAHFRIMRFVYSCRPLVCCKGAVRAAFCNIRHKPAGGGFGGNGSTRSVDLSGLHVFCNEQARFAVER